MRTDRQISVATRQKSSERLQAAREWSILGALNMTFNFDASAEATAPAADLPAAPGEAPPPQNPPGHQPIQPDTPSEEPRPRRKALLVGQPNVGKSVVFGALTGTYVTVSNYPGTTLEITPGPARLGEQLWEIVDTPGTHNLVPMSEDEAVTRDLI